MVTDFLAETLVAVATMAATHHAQTQVALTAELLLLHHAVDVETVPSPTVKANQCKPLQQWKLLLQCQLLPSKLNLLLLQLKEALSFLRSTVLLGLLLLTQVLLLSKSNSATGIFLTNKEGGPNLVLATFFNAHF